MNYKTNPVFSGLVICSILVLICQNAVANDWPYWRGPDRNGISQETDLNADWSENEPEIAWTASIGWGFSAAAIDNGKVFVKGNVDDNDVLYCFDVETGDLKWERSHPEPRTPRQYEGGPNASPVIHNGRVYTLSKTAKIFVRDDSDGSTIWDLDLVERYGIEIPTWGLAGSALIVDDMAVFNVGSYGMAFDKKTGELLWENGTGAGGYATPVKFERDGKTLLAMFVANEFAVLEAETGRILDKFSWPTRYDVNAADPIISGDKIFISSGYNQGCALLHFDNENLTEVWKSRDMRNHMNSSVLWQGNLYGFDESELKCMDFDTGEVLWSQGGLGKGSLILADEKLIILSEDGRLVLAEASPQEYRQLGEKRILQGRCWTMPVLADGRIYARNAAGDFVCVEISK